jgi:hypothetical protein
MPQATESGVVTVAAEMLIARLGAPWPGHGPLKCIVEYTGPSFRNVKNCNGTSLGLAAAVHYILSFVRFVC